MKHFVAIATPDGEIELHRLKAWVRQHTAELPAGTRTAGTTQQIRRALLLVDEVNASRLLQEIIFNSRSRSRTGYTVLHRPVIAR